MILDTPDDDDAPDPQQDFADALAALGLRAPAAGDSQDPAADPATDPPAAPEVYLWPCNAPVWALWQRVQTQWHIGMGGPTGLRYDGVRVVMDFCGLPKKERAWAFECLQGMERAALEAFASQRERE